MMSTTLKTVAFAAGALFSTAALAASSYDEAEVLSAEPVYQTVSYSVPREQCHEEEVAYHDPSRRRGSITPTILGAVIGGALGNAVGHKKRNRQVGTAVGAVLGGSIGADIGRRNRQASDGDVTRYRTERVCRTVEDVREEEQLVGYDVSYAYGGGVYQTRTQHHPGDTLRVRVRVSPAE